MTSEQSRTIIADTEAKLEALFNEHKARRQAVNDRLDQELSEIADRYPLPMTPRLVAMVYLSGLVCGLFLAWMRT